MPNLPRFSLGDLVRPVNKVRRRKASSRILGVVVEVTHVEGFSKYGADYYSYAVHFMASDVVSVGWAEHSLEPL